MQAKQVPWGVDSGIIVLGTAVGFPGGATQFYTKVWEAKRMELKALLSKISALGHSQYEHCLLRASADVCRVMHLLRTTDTTGVQDCLRRMHHDLLEAVETMLGKTLSQDQAEQTFLPVKMGGLGIKSPLTYQHAARLSAVAGFMRNYQTINSALPCLVEAAAPADFTHHLQHTRSLLGPEVQPLKDWNNNPSSVRLASVRECQSQGWQQRISAQLYKTWKQKGSQRDNCRKALQTPNSAAWLNATPSSYHGTRFGHNDYRLALQWWLGLPILHTMDVGSTCVKCGACLDAWGDHAVTCRANGLTLRHTTIQDWLLSTARAAGIACTKEAALPDGTRPADALFHTWRGGKPLAVDLTVVHPLRPSEPRPTPENMRGLLNREEQAKVTKYQATCDAVGWSFAPLVLHPWGGTTTKGAALLHHLCRLYAEAAHEGMTKSERVERFWQSYTSCIMKSVANQLQGTTYTGPEGPNLPQMIPLDGYGNEVPIAWAPQGAGARKRARGQEEGTTTHQPYQ